MKKISSIAALLLSGSLAGCMTVPMGPADVITVAQLVNQIQCQLRDQIAQAGANQLWTGYSAKLALTVTTGRGIGRDIDGNLNISSGFYLYVGPYASSDLDVQQVVHLPEISFRLYDLRNLSCLPVENQIQLAAINGGNALASLFAFADGSARTAGTVAGRTDATFSAATAFALSHYGQADIEIGFFDFGAGADRSAQDIHTAIIAFTRDTGASGVSGAAEGRLTAEVARQREATRDIAYYGGS